MALGSRLILLLFSIFLLIISVKSEQCIQKSPCLCEFNDGRIINLKQLDTKYFLKAFDQHNLTYFFHPCSDSKPVFPDIKNITFSDCDKTSLCLLNTTGNGTVTNLGIANDAKFTFGQNSKKYLLYNNKKHDTVSMIHLGCSDYPEPILVFKQTDGKTHDLILFAKEVCPVFEQQKALSTGSVLVILLFTFTSVYLLGGAAVLHFLRGARGKEMIPNIEFWSDLPSLVRDGAIFLQNGCKPPVVSNSDSYDAI